MSTVRLRVVIVMLVTSVAINIALAYKLSRFDHLVSATREQRLQPGTSVPPLKGVDLRGQVQTLVYNAENKPAILYVFTPTCIWCKRNLDNLKTLVAHESGEYRFIGVSLAKEGLPEYVVAQGLTMPVYTGLSAEILRAYKMGGTPQTIVVSPEGRVVQNWMGAYVGDQKSQVEAFFHISLPGLRESPKAETSEAIPVTQGAN